MKVFGAGVWLAAFCRRPPGRARRRARSGCGARRRNGENLMLRRMMRGATIAVTALWTAGVAGALEGAQNYPDWKGQWNRAPTGVAGQPQPPFDPSKPWGLRQEAPLTPEYQAIYEANFADQDAGSPGLNGASCRSHGM